MASIVPPRCGIICTLRRKGFNTECHRERLESTEWRDRVVGHRFSRAETAWNCFGFSPELRPGCWRKTEMRIRIALSSFVLIAALAAVSSLCAQSAPADA